MKKIFVMMLLASLTMSVAAKKRVVVLTTQPQMHCAKCENRVKNLIAPIAGVKNVETDLEEQTVTVVYNDKKTNVEALMAALSAKGYKARELQEGEKIVREEHVCKEKQ